MSFNSKSFRQYLDESVKYRYKYFQVLIHKYEKCGNYDVINMRTLSIEEDSGRVRKMKSRLISQYKCSSEIKVLKNKVIERKKFSVRNFVGRRHSASSSKETEFMTSFNENQSESADDENQSLLSDNENESGSSFVGNQTIPIDSLSQIFLSNKGMNVAVSESKKKVLPKAKQGIFCSYDIKDCFVKLIKFDASLMNVDTSYSVKREKDRLETEMNKQKQLQIKENSKLNSNSALNSDKRRNTKLNDSLCDNFNLKVSLKKLSDEEVSTEIAEGQKTKIDLFYPKIKAHLPHKISMECSNIKPLPCSPLNTTSSILDFSKNATNKSTFPSISSITPIQTSEKVLKVNGFFPKGDRKTNLNIIRRNNINRLSHDYSSFTSISNENMTMNEFCKSLRSNGKFCGAKLSVQNSKASLRCEVLRADIKVEASKLPKINHDFLMSERDPIFHSANRNTVFQVEEITVENNRHISKNVPPISTFSPKCIQNAPDVLNTAEFREAENTCNQFSSNELKSNSCRLIQPIPCPVSHSTLKQNGNKTNKDRKLQKKGFESLM